MGTTTPATTCINCLHFREIVDNPWGDCTNPDQHFHVVAPTFTCEEHHALAVQDRHSQEGKLPKNKREDGLLPTMRQDLGNSPLGRRWYIGDGDQNWIQHVVLDPKYTPRAQTLTVKVGEKITVRDEIGESVTVEVTRVEMDMQNQETSKIDLTVSVANSIDRSRGLKNLLRTLGFWAKLGILFS